MLPHASRFAAHLTAVISGSLAVIFALTLRPAVSAWVVLGLAGTVVIAALAAFAVPDQGTGPRCVEVLLGLIGAWAIVAGRVFSDPSVTKWLSFADGAAIWVLGTVGLVVHERLVESRLSRMVEEEHHRLALTRRPATPETAFDRTEV
ncbi:MAG TPA: hypothetical protein VG405_07410 [Solirubrobacteraceae bacterium]|nr:hypothetical protein [Solirubrobacteraceae bacterium]